MEFLIHPDVSYVLLILGFLVVILALFAPGTGILEVIALMTLVMAAYGIVNLPTNPWALAIMALGLVPLLFTLRPVFSALHPRRDHRALLVVLSALIFLLGADLLYQGKGLAPAVNGVLILLMTPLIAGSTWLIAKKTLEAANARPIFDLDRLIGMTGQAVTDIRSAGSVYVDGESWTAHSREYIPAGSPVRVLRRAGLAVEVEKEK